MGAAVDVIKSSLFHVGLEPNKNRCTKRAPEIFFFFLKIISAVLGSSYYGFSDQLVLISYKML